MNKEMVISVIERRGSGIPALYSWFANETYQKYSETLKELLNLYHDDVIISDILFYPRKYVAEKEEWYDEWGILWKQSPHSVGVVPIDSKLRDWSNLSSFLDNGFPDLNKTGRYDYLREMRYKNPDTYILGTWWYGPFEKLKALRGVENLFIDFYYNRDKIYKLGEALVNYYLKLITNLIQNGADGIFICDDFGMQDSLFMRPEDWRDIFKPWYSKMVDHIHMYNKHAFIHSCGNIESIIEDLIEIQVDVIHPIQPGAMNQKRIADAYKGKITFFGGIDVQSILPFGEKEDIQKHIKHLAEIFSSEGGGYIIAPSNSINPDVPFQNIQAMCKAIYDITKEE